MSFKINTQESVKISPIETEITPGNSRTNSKIKPEALPLPVTRKTSGVSIQLSFKEVPNQAKQEVTLDKVVGEETTTSKYFVSNSFVEKIFDNIRTNSLEFE